MLRNIFWWALTTCIVFGVKAQIEFREPIYLSHISAPHDIQCADFNNDGFVDFIVNNVRHDTISVWLGAHSGGFNGPMNYPVDGSRDIATRYINLGDFNSDGFIDLVINHGGNSESEKAIILMRNNQHGGFVFWKYVQGSTWATNVKTADFNNDGNLDLAVLSGTENTVTILMGDGTGNFALQDVIQVGIDPRKLVIEDLNGDGALDIIVSNLGSNTITVILKTDNEWIASHHAVHIYPNEVVVADFNGDHVKDIIVNHLGTERGKLSLLTCISSPTFYINDYVLRSFTQSFYGNMLTGDFNGDGASDILVTGLGIFPSSLMYLKNTGNGNFLVNEFELPDNFSFSRMCCWTFVPNEHEVFFIANEASSTVTSAYRLYETFTINNNQIILAPKPRTILVSDINEDGLDDLVTTNATRSVSIYNSLGSGQFEKPEYLACPPDPAGLAHVDLNNDGLKDLVISSWPNTTNESTTIYLKTTNGWTIKNINQASNEICALDLNADSNTDLVLGGAIYLGSGNGDFTYYNKLNPYDIIYYIDQGDIDNDGKTDLFTSSINAITIYYSEGALDFQSMNIGAPGLYIGARLMDLNKDGKLDIVTCNIQSKRIFIGLNNGGRFNFTIRYIENPEFSSLIGLSLNDYDKDGNIDLIVIDQYRAKVFIYKGNGNGEFQLLPEYELNEPPSSIAVTDLNEDNYPDLVLGLQSTGTLAFLINDFPPVPTVPVSNIQISEVTQTNAKISWTKGDGIKTLVTVTEGDLPISLPQYGLIYEENPKFKLGSALNENQYVVYANTGASVTVTELKPDTYYKVSVFEFNTNSKNTIGNYLVSPFGEKSFKTLITGISDPEQPKITIYPNPLTDQHTIGRIYSNENLIPSSIKVIDLLGKEAMIDISDYQDNQTINCKYLAPGVYILLATTYSNKSIRLRFVRN